MYIYEEKSSRGESIFPLRSVSVIFRRSLSAATDVKDMNAPGYDFHQLKGEFKDFYSVHINGNWTIIFRFANGDASDVNLVDYH